MREQGELWIALVRVEPSVVGALPADAAGAYVQTIALARDETDFRSVTRSYFNSRDLEPVEVENLATLADRLASSYIDDELQEVVSQVDAENRVVVGTLHTYDRDE